MQRWVSQSKANGRHLAHPSRLWLHLVYLNVELASLHDTNAPKSILYVVTAATDFRNRVRMNMLLDHQSRSVSAVRPPVDRLCVKSETSSIEDQPAPCGGSGNGVRLRCSIADQHDGLTSTDFELMDFVLHYSTPIDHQAIQVAGSALPLPDFIPLPPTHPRPDFIPSPPTYPRPPRSQPMLLWTLPQQQQPQPPPMPDTPPPGRPQMSRQQWQWTLFSQFQQQWVLNQPPQQQQPQPPYPPPVLPQQQQQQQQLPPPPSPMTTGPPPWAQQAFCQQWALFRESRLPPVLLGMPPKQQQPQPPQPPPISAGPPTWAKQWFRHQWVLIHQSPQPPPPMPLGSPPRTPRK